MKILKPSVAKRRQKNALRKALARTIPRLLSLYTERHRTYHNWEHIRACQRELRHFPLGSLPKNIDFGSLVLALNFHDAIYDPRRNDNEEKSAKLFVKLFGHMVSARRRNKIVALIMATKHDRAPKTFEEKLICDIDLAIFGQPRPVFDAYEKAIRKEYAWVPIKDFRAGRAAVLKHFLAQPSIYRLTYFKRCYEKAARANLKRSLKALLGA